MTRLNKIITHILLTFLLLIPFASLSHVAARDVSFDIKHIDIQADVEANGDVRFKDTYTYDVDYFNGAEISIDHDVYPMSNYRVSVVNPNKGQMESYTESYTGSPGTYSVEHDGNIMRFRIYRPTSNEKLEIIMEYTLEGLVTNYQDTAQLNRKVVGYNVNDRVDVTGKINLPGAVEDVNDFRVWGHGAPNGKVEPVTEGSRSYVTFEVMNNAPNQFVEVNTIFPTYLTPNNRNVVDQPMKEKIIQEENATVEADKKAHEASIQRNNFIIYGLAALNLLVGLGVTFYVTTSRKRANPEPAHVPEHIYELPEELTPAVMATAALREEPTADDFSATILDLARRGYLDIEEIKDEKRGLFKFGEKSTLQIEPGKNIARRDQLLAHEKAVMDYLIPNNQPTTLYDIERHIKQSDAFKRMQNGYWEKFSDSAEVRGMQRKGLAPKERSLGFILNVIGIIVAGGSLVTSIVMFANEQAQYPQGFYILFPLLLVVLFWQIGLLLFRLWRPPLSYEEDKLKKEWAGFKNMLDDVGNMNMREVASLPLWGEYLAYAVSLGVGEKVLKAMNKQYGMEELQQSSVPLVFYSNPTMLTRGLGEPVSRGLASAAPQANYSGSNTGGFGGGFSSGSSGGSGGGGGAGGF